MEAHQRMFLKAIVTLNWTNHKKHELFLSCHSSGVLGKFIPNQNVRQFRANKLPDQSLVQASAEHLQNPLKVILPSSNLMVCLTISLTFYRTWYAPSSWCSVSSLAYYFLKKHMRTRNVAEILELKQVEPSKESLGEVLKRVWTRQKRRTWFCLKMKSV